ASVLTQEAEMIDHRVSAETDFADDADALGLGRDAFERNALLRSKWFAAVQAFQKIEMPHRAADFTIGHALQSDLSLFGDERRDNSIFHRLELGRGDFAILKTRASFLQPGRSEEAAHVIGPKRRGLALHFAPLRSHPLRSLPSRLETRCSRRARRRIRQVAE